MSSFKTPGLPCLSFPPYSCSWRNGSSSPSSETLLSGNPDQNISQTLFSNISLNYKSHDIACCENVSLSNVRSYSSDVSTRRLPKHERNKDDINRHAKVDRGKPRRPRPYTKSYRQSRNTKNIVFPREKHTNWLSNSNCYMWVALFQLNSSYLGMCVCVCVIIDSSNKTFF